MEKIENLLLNISIIQKKYEDLAEYSGEHYNVFDILGVSSDELSHSAILANLLNARGKHGQRELFLNLFLREAKQEFVASKKINVFENFNAKNSFAIKEKYAGRVDYIADQGGKIDIVINDGKSNIIIENKINAGDQVKQLIRYSEYDKNAPILYLTLNGKVPSPNSKGELILNQDFVCISYSIFIVTWLENCIKEVANKPIIRETLNQYLFLIKSLTNQSNNNQMSEEIDKIILKSKESFTSYKLLYNEFNNIANQIISEDFLSFVRSFCTANNLHFEVNPNFNKGTIYVGFEISNYKLIEHNLKITFHYEQANFKSALLGFNFIDISKNSNYENIIIDFKSLFNESITTSANFACYTWFKDMDNLKSFNKLENIKYGTLPADFCETISKMLKIIPE